jgi:hypothetical protein
VSWRTGRWLYVQGIWRGRGRGLQSGVAFGLGRVAAMNDLAVALHAFARNAASASAE